MELMVSWAVGELGPPVPVETMCCYLDPLYSFLVSMNRPLTKCCDVRAFVERGGAIDATANWSYCPPLPIGTPPFGVT